MAGDWIKMRSNLWDDPRVSKLCDLCDCGEAQVIGGLYWLWVTADQHTETGLLPGLTLRQIDRKTGVKGLGEALVAVGWITNDDEGVCISRFEEHNGASAKKRCQTAKRVATHRTSNADVTHEALQVEHTSVSDALAREEKRREETVNEANAVVVPASDGEQEPTAAQPATAKAKRGARLPDDWKLPRAWGEWALAEFPGWSADMVRMESDKFADYWRAKAGKDACKTDWQATWRNWCRNAKLAATGRPNPAAPTESFRERDDRLAREKMAAFLPGIAAKAPAANNVIDITTPPFAAIGV